MVSRFGGLALAVTLALGPVPSFAVGPTVGARAAPPAEAGHPPAQVGAGTGNSGVRDAAPQVSQDAAARARMHECGHQWASIKKAGTAGTMTWKEFSATCLVVSK